MTQRSYRRWRRNRGVARPLFSRFSLVLAQNEAEGRKSLRVLDNHLATTPYMVGGRFTLTDIIMGFATNWARRIGWADGLEHVLAYNARLLARPLCPYPKGGLEE